MKLAIPPPIRRALFRPSGSAAAHCKTIKHILFQTRWRHGEKLKFQRNQNDSYIKNNSCILQHLLLIWSPTVLCIVSKLLCITQISNLDEQKEKVSPRSITPSSSKIKVLAETRLLLMWFMKMVGALWGYDIRCLTVSAYITLAPPPATIVQMRPFGFNTVNFRDALVCNADRRIYFIHFS